MDSFDATTQYLTRNGQPWFPVMGELHYSRLRRESWPLELAKMKAAGVTVVSSYVIWLHHEEIEGEISFDGGLDAGAFVRECARQGLLVWLRIGPWAHGEVRNGGFPDWLLRKDFEPRTNHPAYFAQVERFYKAVYGQVEGLFQPQGGPIVGVQIENEYGHCCGGEAGKAGEEHMRTLHRMAVDIGFAPPYFSATGWGGAYIADMLPVMGGYCDAPWDQSIDKLPPSGNFVFSHQRNDANIGSDLGVGAGLSFDPERYPFLTAELGGGLQVTKHRRPVPTAADTAAMSLCKLGSGAQLLGYYMYHGGTNPVGRLSTFQESRATGYNNDLPVLSYDFNAPIREYGQVADSAREIKLLAYFLADFGTELCGMPAEIPPQHPADFATLRTSMRHNGKSGYLFVNNHQRQYAMAAHKGAKLRALDVEFPPMDIGDGEFFFLPVHLPMPGGTLRAANATPLCRLNEGTPEERLVLYTDREPWFALEGEAQAGSLLFLTRQEALNAWRIRLGGRQHLAVSNNIVLQSGDKISVTGEAPLHIKLYPKPEHGFEGWQRLADEGEFAVFERKGHECNATVEWRQCKDSWEIEIEAPSGDGDYMLCIDYVGDTAGLYRGQELVADNFYTGAGAWEIGLSHIGGPGHYTLKIKELTEKTPVYLEHWPSLTEGGRLVKNMCIKTVYLTQLNAKM